MKKSLMLCGLVAALSIPAVALGGFTAYYQVSLGTTTASGTMVGAKNASDNKQYIMCVDGDYAYCFARDASSTVKSGFHDRDEVVFGIAAARLFGM